ncbi:hypothetical protein GCG54_00011114 [Colletotrichum gloeosporioides]|uniref:Heterokaryon incompatibility domain-containing protein n=1 Tax=Colletotrichum gloeosporioides TaxID=474922 RepID=A0A8H4FNN1_COLGL|nr:uncharacterized protein GCG54_00011114 [Colletotrichum gloeosporioides]KAF3808923.1 hypothetical protein GCG54_00011114 [Colletotrichum gloeosporioides]
MAEVAGLALSGVALASLITSCIDIIKYWNDGRFWINDLGLAITKGLCDEKLVSEIQPIRESIIGATALRHSSKAQNSTPNAGNDDHPLTLHEWIRLTQHIAQSLLRQYVNLALAVAFLRESGRQATRLPPDDIESIWSLVQGVLSETSIIRKVDRNVEGFISITLWCMAKDGNVQESVQLEVWFPGVKRGNEGTPVISSHQQLDQSWVLLGQARDYRYQVQKAQQTTATHARYELSSSHTNSKSTENPARYVNTGELVQANEIQSEMRSRHMTYSRYAGAFCRLEVDRDEMHVAFSFSNYAQGSRRVPSILVPAKGGYFQESDIETTTPATITAAIETFRNWEQFHQHGLAHTRRNELEEALRAHHSALAMCDGKTDLPHATHYRYVVLAELGYVYRMLGRFARASECLEDAVRNMPPNESRLKALGELAVVYRHLDKLKDAKRTCEEQYESAKLMGLELETERAIGNLGMVNYQLFLTNNDNQYLTVAIKQLEERVDICRRLRIPTDTQEDSRRKAAKAQTATAHEAIAFARLSLCYTVQGDLDKAISAAWDCQELSIQSGDPSKIAFSRLFYGRALLKNEQKEKALAEFNPSDGNTPVAALSKEPCEEYRGYIQEMIDAGADLTLRDKSGYSALDFAVYSGDDLTQNILIEGLRRQLNQDKVEQHRLESSLRKGYRELFQEILRPVLLEGDKRSSIKRLRQAYAKALAADEEKARQFDAFKYVRFADFARHGKLPKSSENLTRRFGDDDDEDLYVIFMSYTWSKKKRTGEFSPDDMENTKYHQMINALESFLLEHPNVSPETVCVWLDWACIDQDNRDIQARGVAALPMCVAQCNAMISITEERSYHAHGWYEFEYDARQERNVLRDGKLTKALSVASAKVTVESDRPQLEFLERQAKLLDITTGA